MYLLAVFTLVISLVGVYAQVVAVQSARMLASQTGIGQAMLLWHKAAISMAASIIKTNAGGYAGVALNGCSLGFIIPPGAPIGRCPTPLLNGGGTDAGGGTITTGLPNPQLNLIYSPNALNPFLLNECVHLPAKCTARNGFGCTTCVALYDTTNYQFYSVLFTEAGTNENVVVTFVTSPVITASNPLPGFVTLAGGNIINVTQAGLIQQIQTSGTPNFVYGHINAAGNSFIVSGNTYTLPGSFASIANVGGSVGVIGSPDGF